MIIIYIGDIKLFAKNKNETETLIQVVRIYSVDTGMEFGIEKYWKELNYHITKKSETSEKSKLSSTLEY